MSFVARHGIYAAPRVFLDLREAGETCSKHRFARLMRDASLRRCMAIALGAGRKALGPDLQPPRATIHGDAAEQRLGDRHHRHSDVAGLAQAGRDHGSLLAPDDSATRITSSRVSRKSNCWDNAVAEAFFGSLKKERIKKQIYKNRELAIAALAAYIDTFYNRTRRQLSRRAESGAIRGGSQTAPTRSSLNPGNSKARGFPCLRTRPRSRLLSRSMPDVSNGVSPVQIPATLTQHRGSRRYAGLSMAFCCCSPDDRQLARRPRHG